MRVYECLQAFASVWVMSELQFMRFTRWAVIRESLVRVGAYEVNREMYRSCMSGDLLGCVLAGKWRIWRERRERRKSRVKAGEFFFAVFVVVTLLHQYLRVGSLFPVLASSLRCSSTTLTDDRLMPVSWRWEVVRRVRTVRVGLSRVYVGLGRVMSGQKGLISYCWASSTFFDCLGWVTGSIQSWKGPPLPSDSLPATVMD